jgi:hypothetical protein
MRAITFGAGRRALEFGRHKINLHPATAPTKPHAARPTPGSADLCLVISTPIEDAVAALDRHGVPVEAGPLPRTCALGTIVSAIFNPTKLIECRTIRNGRPLSHASAQISHAIWASRYRGMFTCLPAKERRNGR